MNERWHETFIATQDYVWNLPTKTTAGYTGLYGKHGSFTEAVNATQWLMMFVHPQSPLQDKSELLVRALRRIDVYLEDDYHGRKNYHFFALGAALMGAVILDQTYPEMILPRQKARWTEAIRRIAKDHNGNPGGNYSNADLGYGRIRIACGLFLNDKPYTERGLAQVYTWDANIRLHGPQYRHIRPSLRRASHHFTAGKSKCHHRLRRQRPPPSARLHRLAGISRLLRKTSVCLRHRTLNPARYAVPRDKRVATS